MPQAIGEVPVLVVAEQEGMPVAFAGIKGQKLEMLFVSAENRGKGIGKRLLQYAVDNHGVSEVVVNEQNAQAAGFYLHVGFVCKKSDVDEQGNPYPILYMKKVLANPETGYSPMEEFDIPEDFNPNAGCQ